VIFGQGKAASMGHVTFREVLVGNDLKLGFRSYGQLDQTTAAIVTLTDGQRSMTIRLDPVTGLPTMTQ
jgi:hypothetical protein